MYTAAISPGLKQGDARWFFGMLATIRANAADTDGQYTLVEVVAPPGLESPLHVHHTEDEAFLMLEGDVVLHVGDESIEATAGQFAFGPREVPHRSRSVRPEPACCGCSRPPASRISSRP